MRILNEIVHLFKDWIEAIFTVITELGQWGIMLGLLIEVIPSEIVLSFGGYLVSQGSVTFVGAVVFGTIGGTLAQIFVYWIGRYGGRPFLEKYGKYFLIHKKQIDISEQWFARYGTGVIFTARFIPIVRHAISIPAGIAKVSLWRFTLLTTLAIIPWSAFFIYLGYTLGENWREIDDLTQAYIMPLIIGALTLLVVYFMYKVLKKKSFRGSDSDQRKSGIADHLELLDREYKVLHHRVMQNGSHTQDIHHLVVGPNGVFHITNGDQTLQMYRHDYNIKALLRAQHITTDVKGILCMINDKDGRIDDRSNFIKVKLDQLVHRIMQIQSKQPINNDEIKKITELFLINSKSIG